MKKMLTKNTFTISLMITLFSNLINEINSLTCFGCNGLAQSDCNDPFDKVLALENTNTYKYYTVCESGYDICQVS